MRNAVFSNRQRMKVSETVHFILVYILSDGVERTLIILDYH